MATLRTPIFGFNTLPDTSGEVFFEPFSVKGSTATIDPLVLIMGDTAAKIGIHGMFTVPENYVGTPVLSVRWTANDGTTNSAVFDFEFTPRGTTESFDVVTEFTADTVTDGHAGSAFARNEARITSMSDADFNSDEDVPFTLSADMASGSHTITSDLIITRVMFEYSDT